VKRSARFVEDLIRGRRPRRFRTDAEEAEALHAAAMLRVGAGADLPDPGFVAGLENRLRRELAPAAAPSRVSRRRLFGTAGAIAVAAVGGGVAGRVIEGIGQPGASVSELVPPGGSWRPVVVASAVPDGGVVRFSTGSMTGFVVRRGDTITGLSAVCTHLGCLLQAEGGGHLACPCHRTAFALDGTVAEHFLPKAPAPLPRLRVRVVREMVEVFAV
jgi:nitrite reductase/ring-hydroxylating ferredoxin subunit